MCTINILLNAVVAGNTKECLMWIEDNINEKNVNQHHLESGRGFLHIFCEYGLIECVTLLIEKGADVNIEDVFKETPLHKAAMSGKHECIRILGRLISDINAGDATGRTALHVAAGNGHVECIWVLLELGANINAVESRGWTALHYATIRRYEACVEVLLQNNIDTALGSYSAEEIAREYGCTRIEKFIIGHRFKNTKRAH